MISDLTNLETALGHDFQRPELLERALTHSSHAHEETKAAGGDDSGPGPYDFLLSALGACKSMTMRLYADRKSFPLERATVTLSHSKIYAKDCAECETRDGMLDEIKVAIGLEGPLDDDPRKRILEIADKCPVHRTLTSEIRIVTRAAG